MISTLVVTLGKVAESLIDSSERIIGKSPSVSYFCIDWGEKWEPAKARLERRIREVSQGEGVLLLTDMFGGTSTNIALDFQRPGEVEVVTGVNLPMVVKAMTLPRGISVAMAATQLREQGRKAIYIASEKL